ncbi:MAG: beta-ketoacyl-ACP synthase II [Aquificaceae bacterium]|nr:beta-ketoacyl-ACP synthase II [Aquificaceae bacterium]MCX8076618.1 beta-ketoacyl-ACP synthase II [Aquificaceae bacterium]
MRRVVVTGLGVVTPIGTGVEKFWSNLIAGVSGIDTIKRFDPVEVGLTVHIAGEVKDFEPEKYFDKKDAQKVSEFIKFAVAASEEAIKDGGLLESRVDPYKIGVIIGTGIGGLRDIEEQQKVLMEKGPRRVSPFFIPYGISNMASGLVAIRYGFKGPNYCVVSACATGNHAIGDAMRLIQKGDIDVAIAGGCESAITPLGVAGFAVMRALSTRNHEPQKASRPFDMERDGFVMGEGAGVLVLEEYEHAKARGAKIYAELVGYGATDDAYHITAPCVDGEGAYMCMKLALEDARIRPEEVEYINAHGTSTPLNDKSETLAIKRLFGEHAYRLKVSSNKSMIGHLLGAAGAVEAVATVKTVSTGIIPPTINLENPDPECDLDYVPNKAIEYPVNYALSNSFGFGGTNACLVFKRV